MGRRRLVELKRAILFGVEGKSERALARFLERCCEEQGLHLSLRIGPARGGDSVAVVEEAGRYLHRSAWRREVSNKLVLLDLDRVQTDLRAGRDCRAVASKWRLELVFQDPNIEGLLLRLHPKCEQRRVPARIALTELKKVWPDYDKPPTVDSCIPSFCKASDHAEDLAIHPLFHQHAPERLHQRTNPILGPVGKMVVQHQPLPKQRRVRLFFVDCYLAHS